MRPVMHHTFFFFSEKNQLKKWLQPIGFGGTDGALSLLLVYRQVRMGHTIVVLPW